VTPILDAHTPPNVRLAGRIPQPAAKHGAQPGRLLGFHGPRISEKHIQVPAVRTPDTLHTLTQARPAKRLSAQREN